MAINQQWRRGGKGGENESGMAASGAKRNIIMAKMKSENMKI